MQGGTADCSNMPAVCSRLQQSGREAGGRHTARDNEDDVEASLWRAGPRGLLVLLPARSAFLRPTGTFGEHPKRARVSLRPPMPPNWPHTSIFISIVIYITLTADAGTNGHNTRVPCPHGTQLNGYPVFSHAPPGLPDDKPAIRRAGVPPTALLGRSLHMVGSAHKCHPTRSAKVPNKSAEGPPRRPKLRAASPVICVRTAAQARAPQAAVTG